MNKLISLMVNLPEDVERLVIYGDFTKAVELIELYMARNIPQILKDRLNFEKDRIRRLKQEYTYSFDEALSLTQKNIKDFTKEELEYLKDERYADWTFIDGKIRFHNKFLDNSIKVHNAFRDRLINPEPADNSNVLEETIDDIIKNGEKKYLIHVA